MNLSIFFIAVASWALLFLQALHAQPTDAAPWLFFASGVAQWVAGASFPGMLNEVRRGQWRFW